MQSRKFGYPLVPFWLGNPAVYQTKIEKMAGNEIILISKSLTFNSVLRQNHL